MAVDCKILTVKPYTAPEAGSILFTSTPAGADIYLGISGTIPIYTGLQTPNIIPNITPGNYTYILKKSGYNDIEDTLVVNPGETTPIVKILILKIPLHLIVSIPLIYLLIDNLI